MNEKNLSLARSADFRQMIDNGAAIADEIEEQVRELASKMHRIHGGDWRSRVDHDTGFISVRQL